MKASETRLNLKKSQEYLERAKKVIPGASQTFSKAYNQFVQGASPVFIQRAKGCRVWDVDGNEYIDYTMALAPFVLGYSDPDVNRAVSEQLPDGTAFTLPHPLEFQVAEKITSSVPCAEMVRFCKNGSDATAGAVRLARAYTGRDRIACSGYHGWQDWYIGTTTKSRGVPEAVKKLTHTFAYNQIESLDRLFKEFPNQFAAVVMEPVGIIEPSKGFLESVKELAHKNGALLIFDEIVTGFRFAVGGAQEYFKVTPDLGCFGKAMANGFPLAAVAGRAELMELFQEIFFSFTFGGETLSLAAASATIDKLNSQPVIPHLWAQGKKLRDGYNRLATEAGIEATTSSVGLGPRTMISFKKNGEEWLELKSLFQQECTKRGVLFTGGHNLSYAHSDVDIQTTLETYKSALEIVAAALEKNDVTQRLEGKPLEPVFRKA